MYQLLTRRELEVINKEKLKYPLAIAEKDYFLTLASKIIYDSPLRDKLVFKGGTAIHHCYLEQTRFSEDLDFTSLDKSITLEEVKSVLKLYDFLEIKKDYLSKATIKIERLKYSGPLGLANSLKLEIDFTQNVVLPANNLPYKNIWKVNTNAMVMDIREICAEKIRATASRARYRDFYDLVLLFKNFKFDFKEIKDLIRRKENRIQFSKNSIYNNWEIARKEKEIELARIYYEYELDEDKIIELIKTLNLILPV